MVAGEKDGGMRQGVWGGHGHPGASLVTQLVKNQLAMWETWVQSLGWEDPLEKGMATHKVANKDVVYSKGNLLSITWQPGWERSLGEFGYMYMYG